MATHFCIGGPLAGQHAEYELACFHNYISYNSAHGSIRGKSAIARAKKRGIVVTPSMVWLHVSCFQDQSDKEIADAKAESD